MIVTFVSDKMIERFPHFLSCMHAISRRENAFLRIVEGTKDIWIRDYMPIILPSGKMVQFRYEPSYLVNGFNHLRSETGLLEKQFGFTSRKSKLNLDGGNYVRCDDKVLICDRVLTENSNLSKGEIVARLKFILEAKEIVLIPTHPFDPVGHADGIVAFSDTKKLIIEKPSMDASEAELNYYNKLKCCLGKLGYNLVEFPVDVPETGYASNWDCRGSYLNYTIIGNSVLIPVYGNTDRRKIFEFFIPLFPHRRVWMINCEEIAKQGGAIHCATWTA